MVARERHHMQRLTDNLKHPLTTFKRCQLCGFEGTDICEFRMWNECDDSDKAEPGNVIIVCRQKACGDVIDKHPRLYRQVPWGAGGPGMFMLLCGDCEYRDGSKCRHPNLKANGGEGLEVKLSGPVIHVCYVNGTGGMWPNSTTSCAGCTDPSRRA